LSLDHAIHDVASSHGTLGFITELKVNIRPLVSEALVGALAEFDDYDGLGQAVDGMVKRESPIRYGETIVMAHPDVREGFNPPLLILQYPEEYEPELNDFIDVKRLDQEEFQRMKDIRIKLPKRNPKDGVQFALFEGYGFHGESLRNMQRTLGEIDALLRGHGLVPFAKYGHAPSKWYLGDNSAAYGIIMHSREIRPEGKSGNELYQILLDIVDKCESLDVTPKPEHKWPFSDKVKIARMEELREAMGHGFNSFLLDEECGDVLSSMV
ncbi:MAG: hypothetical protein ACFFD9_06410, partial [Candidatus Thorarchaeota archaeon]